MRREKIVCLWILLAAFSWAAAAQAEDKEKEPAALKAEIEQLRRERDTLEAQVQTLQGKLEEARAAVISAKIQSDTFERRCRQLQDELKLIKAEKPAGIAPVSQKQESPVQAIAPPGSKPNAKETRARGKVSGVGGGGGLAQISIGSDSGIKEGQTMEVFRLGTTNGKDKVNPIYLGTLKLIRVDPQAALGQFKAVPGLDRRVKIGDEVASELFVK